jgi:hypothetical protein
VRRVVVVALTAGCFAAPARPGGDAPVSDAPVADARLADAPTVHVCVADNFDGETTIDGSRFTVSPPPMGGVVIASGAVRITWPPSNPGPDKGLVTAKGIFDLRGGGVTVNLLQLINDNVEANLYVVRDFSHNLLIRAFPTYIQYDFYDGNTYTKWGEVDNSSPPVTLSISVDAGGQVVTFGAGSNQTQIAAPFAWDQLTVGFDAGANAGNTMLSGEADFDNFSATGNCP